MNEYCLYKHILLKNALIPMGLCKASLKEGMELNQGSINSPFMFKYLSDFNQSEDLLKP